MHVYWLIIQEDMSTTNLHHIIGYLREVKPVKEGKVKLYRSQDIVVEIPSRNHNDFVVFRASDDETISDISELKYGDSIRIVFKLWGRMYAKEGLQNCFSIPQILEIYKHVN